MSKKQIKVTLGIIQLLILSIIMLVNFNYSLGDYHQSVSGIINFLWVVNVIIASILVFLGVFPSWIIIIVVYSLFVIQLEYYEVKSGLILLLSLFLVQIVVKIIRKKAAMPNWVGVVSISLGMVWLLILSKF